MSVYTIDILNPRYSTAALPDSARQWARTRGTLTVRVRPLREGAQAIGRLPSVPTMSDLAAHHDEATGVWLLAGTLAELAEAAAEWAATPNADVAALGRELGAALWRATSGPTWSTQIGSRLFHWGDHTHVMGIVNVTPDSFSGDGLLAADDAHPDAWIPLAVEQALAFAAQGADIIDIGGESTRPGATPVDAEEETRRVVPAIEALRRQSDIPISVDTSKASVARAALDAGADMINDVWGLRLDPAMGPLAAERGVPVILMHNRSRPRDSVVSERLGGRYVGVAYDDLMLDLLEELQAQVAVAQSQGIARERLIVDPGLGFGKTVPQNLALLDRCDALRVLGLPILLGPSHKSFIGYTLDLPPEERLHGTMASLAVAIARGGADIVRVHDVEAAVQVVRMADAIVGRGARHADEQG
jgi:dihydropteroate synthase